MQKKKKSDIENTEELPVIHPEDFHDAPDYSGGILPVFAKIGLFLAIVLAVTLISRFLYIRINGETLSLIDDTQLVFSGHNGNGYADAMFHPEHAALQRLEEDRQKLKNRHKDTGDMDTLIHSIGCQLDYKDHLFNGMTVTYTCDYDENAAKKAGYHIIHDVRSYTVMGLSDYTYIDPYKDLHTEWTTGSDEPVLKIIPAKKYTNLFTYTYTYNGGDSVVIKVHPDEQALHQKGYEVHRKLLTRTIPVTPAPSVIRDPENLGTEDTQSLKEQTVKSYITQRSTCDAYAQDKTSLISSDVQILTWKYNEDGTGTAVLSVTNTYMKDGIPVTYSFTVECTGTIWRKADGSVSFSPDSTGTCAFLRNGDRTVIDK